MYKLLEDLGFRFEEQPAFTDREAIYKEALEDLRDNPEDMEALINQI